eukprot:4778482-Prymnesium_polylepis.1
MRTAMPGYNFNRDRNSSAASRDRNSSAASPGTIYKGMQAMGKSSMQAMGCSGAKLLNKVARRADRHSRESIEDASFSISEATAESTTVRSVHLVCDFLLAVGVDTGKAGSVQLFHTNHNALIREWPHEKAVWVVRLTSDGDFVVAAGYDCALSLYNTKTDTTKPMQRIVFQSFGPPYAAEQSIFPLSIANAAPSTMPHTQASEPSVPHTNKNFRTAPSQSVLMVLQLLRGQ